MIQEYKQLVLKDLCARLPYGVKCKVWYGPKSPALNEKDKYTDDILETINPKKGNCAFHNAIGYDFGFFPVEHVKPYLRPMSSMTAKEREELSYYQNPIQRTDFYYSHHIDCRFMIEEGLALEAPEGMYN